MADSQSYERARRMRRSLTPPEAQLWAILKGRKLAGLKFRRQHPIGPYILDFYCAEAKLAVEVDGSLHWNPDQMSHDRRRTAWLKTQGVEVLRLASIDVGKEMEGVLGLIRLKAGDRVRGGTVDV
ncbi:endonuclease domain-containing protein [Brevundimonas faecalis]|uniref:Very-short-patch-repair endonuclease n=1 Tax=Brevundimonas faecalis TaxID=947378 RepID=A0ABV2R898_9CAUL